MARKNEIRSYLKKGPGELMLVPYETADDILRFLSMPEIAETSFVLFFSVNLYHSSNNLRKLYSFLSINICPWELLLRPFYLHLHCVGNQMVVELYRYCCHCCHYHLIGSVLQSHTGWLYQVASLKSALLYQIDSGRQYSLVAPKDLINRMNP